MQSGANDRLALYRRALEVTPHKISGPHGCWLPTEKKSARHLYQNRGRMYIFLHPFAAQQELPVFSLPLGTDPSLREFVLNSLPLELLGLRGDQEARKKEAATLLVASHLCHNSLCFNPAHLVIEPQRINMRRNYCPGGALCDTHTTGQRCLVPGVCYGAPVTTQVQTLEEALQATVQPPPPDWEIPRKRRESFPFF